VTALLKRATFLSFIALLLLILLPVAGQAAGQSINDCEGTYQDLSGDGTPDTVEMRCSFATDRDTVLVFDRAGDFAWDRPWQEAVDFEDDVWVLDAGSDGRANAILDFHRDGQALVADIFDDQNNDGKVAYSVSAGSPVLREGLASTGSATPTVRVVAPEGWWVEGGRTDFNLDILVDGPVNAAFNSERFLEPLKSDGVVDFQIQVRDVNGNGTADYQWVLPLVGVFKSQLIVQEAGVERPMQGGIFWPYLRAADEKAKLSYPIQGYGKTLSPPIGIDFVQSKVVAVGEFVPSRGGDHNWFIYSLLPIEAGQVNEANFENPFAFYDLAGDADGVPELVIRNEYIGEQDLTFSEGRFPQPVDTIRYSWDQNNDGFWDYSFVLIGRYPITQEVALPSFSVRTVPYTEFPDWVVQKKWDAATFVANEGLNYVSTEGIYEGYSRLLRDLYITGLVQDQALVLTNLRSVREGQRQEYNLELLAQPQLYMSPVDRKLHLFGAIEGSWNLDGQRRMEYNDLNGDGYLDSWQFYDGNELQSSLAMLSGGLLRGDDRGGKAETGGGYLLLAEDNRVQVIETAAPSALFFTFPPRNQAEWEELGTLLEQYGREFAPGDLKGMSEQFSGPSMQVIGATMRDLRLVPEGFRCVLDLEPGFHLDSELPISGTSLQEPGSFLLSYQEGGLFLRRSTPPSLSLEGDAIRLAGAGDLHALETVEVNVTVANAGLEDAHAVPLTLTLAGPGDYIQTITRTIDLVPGEGYQAVSIPWPPPRPGRWEVDVRLGAGQRFLPPVAGSTVVSVQPARSWAWDQLLSIASPYQRLTVPAVLFAVMVSAAVVASRLFAEKSGPGEQDG
jgi:hypothetical protein